MSRIARSVIFLLSLLVTGQAAMGATVAAEQQRLAALQQSLDNQQSALRELEAELETYPAKLQEAQGEVETAEAELSKANGELADAQAAAKAEPTPLAEREVNLKELAVRMAQRRVRSENRMLERYTRYRDNLQDDIEKAKRGLATLETRIEQQQRRVELAREEASRPKPPRTPPQVAQPAPKSEPAPKAAAAPAPEPQPQPRAVAKPEPPQPPALDPEEFEAFELARDTMQEVQKLVAKDGNTSDSRTLRLSGSDIKDVPFEYLGAGQYRAEVALPSGRQLFRIDDLRFRATISPENAGEIYVFMVDARDRRRLSATYFKKSLLDYIGRNPVVVETETDAGEEELETTEVTLPSGKSVELSEDDAFSLEIAREHQALLQELKAEKDSEDAFFSNLTLSGNWVESTPFKYIGHRWYVAEVKVQAGRQSIRVNRGSFRIEIPDSDEGEVYLFYVDASRPTRLELTYYKKSILDYL